ncbi:MAG TPA: FAD-dependent oxidoreductase, partial [Trueperaceae bacterium]|nr:FAD-dependent oxidoreductase [Trueperaceae bacterium]
DSGFVYGVPEIYGGRLCMMVPSGGPAGIWVVGRSAGYDPVAFASARVVPFGMAMAEAAGVAAALAGVTNRLPQTASQDPAFVTAVRERLAARGAYLPGVTPRVAIGPSGAQHYDAFRLLVSRGLSVGGYDNDPRLTTDVSSLSFAYLLSNVAARFYYRPEVGQAIVDAAIAAAGGDGTLPLTADVAAATMFEAACLLERCPAAADWQSLSDAGWTWTPTAPTLPLDRGEGYALAAALARAAEGD